MRTGRHPLARYGVALLSAALALAAMASVPRDFLLLPGGIPVLISYFAVLLASWFGGLGPGVLTLLLMIALTLGPEMTATRLVRLGLYVPGGLAICALVEALHSARRRAEAANRAKDRFLAVLSHELRTPLTPVLAGVTGLLDDPAADLPAGFRPVLEMTRRNIELEARLIDDLLDVTRIARGKLRLAPEPVDAHDLVGRAVSICRADLLAAGLRLELDLSATAHRVEADPARLQQVIWNLLKNAIKFTPPGGSISLRTRDEGPPGDGDPRRLVIEVADTGRGIAPADLAKIFEPFRQGVAADSDPSAGAGLGLGLAISRWIVEAHGGLLTAASEGDGRGARFLVRLSTTPAPAPTTPPALPGADAAGVPRRILLVEDNADTLHALSRLLRRRGHEVETAGRLAAALAAAERSEFDLIISDLGLPDGSGLDLIRRIQARRPVPAIALSGYGTDDDLRRSERAGFLVHLTKPVDFATLEAAIRRTVPADGVPGAGCGALAP